MAKRRIGTRSKRLVVAVAAVLFAALVSAPASSREGAPVTGVLIERTVTAVVTVHGDGRPPDVSEMAGFERRVDPSGRTISEGPFPVQAGPLEPLGWQHQCVDNGPVCGPDDGSTVFQGSLASAVWEFYDDTPRDHRFRVALFFAVACANPGACP